MELVKQYLTKLKTLSNYKKITLIILLFSVLISVPRLLMPKTSNLKEEETIFYGYVESYKKTEKYTSFEIRLPDYKNEILKGTVYKAIDLEYHDYIKVEGTLEKIAGYSNFSLFSYKKWANSKNIYYQVDVKEIEVIQKNRNILFSIKNKIVKSLTKNPSASYLFALILGDDSKIDDSVQKSYQENGISHLFALSGMHLSFLVFLLTYLFKKIHLKKNVSHILIFLIITLYLIITSFPVSLLRAYFFFMFKIFKEKLNNEENNIFPLIQAFALLITINPFYLLDIGFSYSFTISFAILIASTKLRNVSSKILSSLHISFLAFFVSLPISICNFHQLNILGIFYNVFYIPFVSVLLFPFSFVVFLFPFLSPIYQILISILETSSIFLSKITIGIFIMRHPTFPVLLLIIALVLISLYLFLKKTRYSVLLISIFILIYSNINYLIKETYLVMLDIGQGDSLLIHLENKNILIDTGGNLYTNLANQVILPYLKSCGIKKLDLLLLTHGDFDHIGESINLVNNFKIENVIFNNGEYNELELDLIKELEEKKIKYYQNIKELNIGNHKLYFLSSKLYDNENDNSNVIYMELNGVKLLLMGDASVKVEKDILEKYALKDIDILKVGHHGSKTSSSKYFVDSINPKYSIISVGKNNRYGHPNKEALDNLSETMIYRTDEDGSVMFKIKNDKLGIETCAP